MSDVVVRHMACITTLLFSTNRPGSQAAFGLHRRKAIDAVLVHGELVTSVACATDRILIIPASGGASST
jgi:hypothetical protein